MTLFDGLLALMLVLLTVVALGRWLLQVIDCLLPVAPPVKDESAHLQLTLRMDTWPVPPSGQSGENTPIVSPYPTGRRIG
ncbi:MAG TPA: hypothetical protein VFV64_00570 [Permianibacter sp.]|nr:hypothetical protein [Permianibacter sp.]